MTRRLICLLLHGRRYLDGLCAPCYLARERAKAAHPSFRPKETP